MTNLVDQAIKENTTEEPKMFDLGAKTDIGIENFAKKFHINPTTFNKKDDD
jgi:hypothetical protein